MACELDALMAVQCLKRWRYNAKRGGWGIEGPPVPDLTVPKDCASLEHHASSINKHRYIDRLPSKHKTALSEHRHETRLQIQDGGYPRESVARRSSSAQLQSER